MRFKLSLAAAICAVSLTVPALAHHSHGNYVDTFKDVEGVVKEVHLVVPHSWVYLEVKDGSGRTANLGARSDRSPGAATNRRHARVHQAGRHR